MVEIDGQPVLWQPHLGPQTRFLSSNAFEVLYGGAAGGGKSFALLYGSLRQVNHPQYRALILRRTFPELRELMDVAYPVFTAIGGVWNAADKRFTFPSGAVVTFGFCETYKDVLQYQGQAFQYIGFDELGQIAEERVWTYLISRCRPLGPNQILQMRASANPGGAGHHWLKKRFVTPCPPSGVPVLVDGHPRAFVAARLEDNPTLMENDPGYGDRLNLLPELERKWLREGDWEAGAGLAFSVTSAHRVPVFQPPSHWPIFSALDWGYNHPFSWGLYTTSEDGVVYCLDTASGRQLTPDQIAERFKEMVGGRKIAYTVAGHDVWHDIKARGERGPTLAESFTGFGFPMVKANISRITGVQNCRRYLQLIDGKPRFAWMDTPSNRKVIECISSRVSDPDRPEDVLKQDANQQGEGGDDHYDQWRYALMSRPLSALPVATDRLKTADRAPVFNMDTQKFQVVKPDALYRELTQQDRLPNRMPRLPRNPR